MKFLGAMSIGLEPPQTTRTKNPLRVVAPVVLPKRIKISNTLLETDETKKLTTEEFQRLVLLEQLKLIKKIFIFSTDDSAPPRFSPLSSRK